jgi:hypothetical protein
MSNLLIGVGGFAQAGKDAFADFLVSDHGFHKEYMSRALETALLRLDPWILNVEDNWKYGTYPTEVPDKLITYSRLHEAVGYDYSKNNRDVRLFLQRLGTEIGRDMCDPDVWVRWAFRIVDAILDNHGSAVITGIRFCNELTAVKQRGGLLVWIERPGVGPVNGHVSDNELSSADFDVTILNNGTLDDLRQDVASLLRLRVS